MAFIAKGLQIFGALALAALLGIIVFLTYSIYSNTDSTRIASKKETQFIFNWSGLNPNQNYKVINSLQSMRSFTGDHLDHFCIEITDFKPDENHRNTWELVSTSNPIVQDAVSKAESFGNASECFGRPAAELKNLQAYVWSIYLHGRNVTAFEIILFDSQTNRLLYVASKT